MPHLARADLFVERKTGPLPRVPFSHIKDLILPKDYTLTVAFITPSYAVALNTKYRNKDYVPDILSFPLSKKEGELYICLSAAQKKAREYGMKYQKYLHLIFIHGCLHLEGLEHGSTMEDKEDTLLDKVYRGKEKKRTRNRY